MFFTWCNESRVRRRVASSVVSSSSTRARNASHSLSLTFESIIDIKFKKNKFDVIGFFYVHKLAMLRHVQRLKLGIDYYFCFLKNEIPFVRSDQCWIQFDSKLKIKIINKTIIKIIKRNKKCVSYFITFFFQCSTLNGNIIFLQNQNKQNDNKKTEIFVMVWNFASLVSSSSKVCNSPTRVSLRRSIAKIC